MCQGWVWGEGGGYGLLTFLPSDVNVMTSKITSVRRSASVLFIMNESNYKVLN